MLTEAVVSMAKDMYDSCAHVWQGLKRVKPSSHRVWSLPGINNNNYRQPWF